MHGLYSIIGEFVTCTESECSCKNNNELCELDCNIQDSCTVANCNDDNVCNVFCEQDNSCDYPAVINGTTSTELTIHCTGFNGCAENTIICGSANCTIICGVSCPETKVMVPSNTQNIEIQCNRISACDKMVVHGQNARNVDRM